MARALRRLIRAGGVVALRHEEGEKPIDEAPEHSIRGTEDVLPKSSVV